MYLYCCQEASHLHDMAVQLLDLSGRVSVAIVAMELVFLARSGSTSRYNWLLCPQSSFRAGLLKERGCPSMMYTDKKNFKELNHAFSLWIFTIGLTLVFSAPTDDQRQVVGPAQPIIAVLGDDVILPCHLEPMTDVQDKTVVWSKPDLKPDPSNPQRGVDYVHLYRNRKELPDMQIVSYSGRTALFRDELKHGNISLKITNVRLEDDGRYKCFISKLKGRVSEAILQLIVVPNTVETSTTELPPNPGNLQTPDPLDDAQPDGDYSRLYVVIPLVVILVVILVILCVYFLARRPQKNNVPDQDAPQKQPLRV